MPAGCITLTICCGIGGNKRRDADSGISRNVPRQTQRGEKEMSRRRNDIRELAARLFAVQERASFLGLFAGDRELLECRKCGLL